jgi:hypothetical protein
VSNDGSVGVSRVCSMFQANPAKRECRYVEACDHSQDGDVAGRVAGGGLAKEICETEGATQGTRSVNFKILSFS